MAQPARPRPRPRQVSKPPTQTTGAVADEDDLFRRNRGRTAQHWKKLEQSAASESVPPVSACQAHIPPEAVPFTITDDDWDVDEPGDKSFQKHRKKRPIKQNDRARWQDTDVTALYVHTFDYTHEPYLGSCYTSHPSLPYIRQNPRHCLPRPRFFVTSLTRSSQTFLGQRS